MPSPCLRCFSPSREALPGGHSFEWRGLRWSFSIECILPPCQCSAFRAQQLYPWSSWCSLWVGWFLAPEAELGSVRQIPCSATRHSDSSSLEFDSHNQFAVANTSQISVRILSWPLQYLQKCAIWIVHARWFCSARPHRLWTWALQFANSSAPGISSRSAKCWWPQRALILAQAPVHLVRHRSDRCPEGAGTHLSTLATNLPPS